MLWIYNWYINYFINRIYKMVYKHGQKVKWFKNDKIKGTVT